MQKHSGFSLIELMMVIAILGVVVSLAYPSFQDTMQKNKVQSQTSKLMNAIYNARSEAVKANQAVTVCKSADQASCTTAGNWEQGWLIFRDTNADGVRQNAELVLRVSGAVAAEVTIRAGSSFADFITYRPDGTTAYLSSNVDAQSFKVCFNMEVRHSSQIFIDASGRPRAESKGVTSCALP